MWRRRQLFHIRGSHKHHSITFYLLFKHHLCGGGDSYSTSGGVINIILILERDPNEVFPKEVGTQRRSMVLEEGGDSKAKRGS
jgi:hypothetical protein